MFNKRKNKKGSFFIMIVIIGGLNAPEYKKFDNELNWMREHYFSFRSLIHGLDCDELQDFLKHIEYSKVIMNLDGGEEILMVLMVWFLFRI